MAPRALPQEGIIADRDRRNDSLQVSLLVVVRSHLYILIFCVLQFAASRQSAKMLN